ncbi:hypothetical protein YB2330_004172 [Saitoella coloradoensis]
MSAKPTSPVEEKLDAFLSHRPAEAELKEKNILKSSTLPPTLQASEADLKRHQLEDKLNEKVLHRPAPEELEKRGILESGEVPGRE